MRVLSALPLTFLLVAMPPLVTAANADQPLKSSWLAGQSDDQFASMLSAPGSAKEIAEQLSNKASLKDMEAFPTPKFYAVESPKAGLGLLSANGRYYIEGQVYDLWQGKELTSVQEVRESRQYVDARQLDLHDKATFSFGEGDQHVTLFSDPTCPACLQMIQQARKLAESSGQYRFSVIEVPAMGKTSLPAVKRLWCSSGSSEAWLAAVLEDDDSGLDYTPDCDTRRMVSAFVAADMIGIDAVPMAVLPDGYLQRGMPRNSSIADLLKEHKS